MEIYTIPFVDCFFYENLNYEIDKHKCHTRIIPRSGVENERREG